jgi:hypothetical protein
VTEDQNNFQYQEIEDDPLPDTSHGDRWKRLSVDLHEMILFGNLSDENEKSC